MSSSCTGSVYIGCLAGYMGEWGMLTVLYRSGLPNDAVSRDKRHHEGLSQTTNEDKGYPSKSDPSSGVQ